MDRIYKLAQGLGTLYNESFDGFFIGQAIVNIYNDYKESTVFIKGEITKDRQMYKRCSAYIFDKDNKYISCNITLLRARNDLNLKEDYIFTAERKYLLGKVNYKEVEEFINITGDKNFIHDEGHLIVPGMILLNYIDNFLCNNKIKFSKLEVKFLDPVYVNDYIYISLDMNRIFIISKNKIVIKGVFK